MNHERQLGHPSVDDVERACKLLSEQTPDIVYITCTAKLHNPSRRKEAALLEVFKANHRAAAWLLHDIEQRNPKSRFEEYRTSGGQSYFTDRIAEYLNREYRDKVRGQFGALNTHVFSGLCMTVATMVVSWLQQMRVAEQSGALERFVQSAGYIVNVGRHAGSHLSSLPRGVIYGYAKLSATQTQLVATQQALQVLLADDDDDPIRLAAEQYRVPFGDRSGTQLGAMSMRELRRLRAYVERQISEVEQWEQLRQAARTYLQYTPPGFPSIKNTGLGFSKRIVLEKEYFSALDEFSALSNLEDNNINLTRAEHSAFRHLQKRTYALTEIPQYLHLYWRHADGIIRGRDIGIAYDPAKRAYILIAYVLGPNSRHRRPVAVNGELFDINNPDQRLESGKRRSGAMIFELEYGVEQQAWLDRARRSVGDWKDHGATSGCARVGKLRAHYDKDRQQWWFELLLLLGFKPPAIQQPQHFMGVHVDTRRRMHVSVLGLDGQLVEYVELTEDRIAELLENKPEQASMPLEQRTSIEKHHRTADALVALCRKYQGLLGIEYTGYKQQLQFKTDGGSTETKDGSRTVSTLLGYKLALAGLPMWVDIRSISPKRDCGRCGLRQTKVQNTHCFICSECGHEEVWHRNAAREVARRTLWQISRQIAK